jgi:hypothetical protein
MAVPSRGVAKVQESRVRGLTRALCVLVCDVAWLLRLIAPRESLL